MKTDMDGVGHGKLQLKIFEACRRSTSQLNVSCDLNNFAVVFASFRCGL
jgi:hypothetical protein